MTPVLVVTHPAKWTETGRVRVGKNWTKEHECICTCDAIGWIRKVNGTLRSECCLACAIRTKVCAKITKHGHACYGLRSRTHSCWNAMLQRCRNETNASFKDYGARGIFVCERWTRFKNFLADMGEQPPGLSLERKDNDGPYCKENCVWATRRAQARNKRNNRCLSLNGETMTVVEWAERTGISQYTLASRLNVLEWNVERALTTAVPPDAPQKFHGNGRRGL